MATAASGIWMWELIPIIIYMVLVLYLLSTNTKVWVCRVSNFAILLLLLAFSKQNITTLEILSKGNLIPILFIELVANWWYTFYYIVPKSNVIKMPWYNVIHWVWNCLLFSKETYLSLTAGIFISTKCIFLSLLLK